MKLLNTFFLVYTSVLLHCFAQNLSPTPMPRLMISSEDFLPPATPVFLEAEQIGIDYYWSGGTIGSDIEIRPWNVLHELKASDDILLETGIFQPIGTREIYAHIGPISHHLAWFEPASTPFQVGKYEKLEIGVSLPEDIRAKIEGFIHTGDTINYINPYLEWQLKVVADFYLNGVLKKTVDGFYYEEFERDETDPILQNQHWNKLGENYGWEGNVDFNFRVRAALPETGNWTCKIRMVTPNQTKQLRNVDFEVVPSTNPGFVKVGANKRYFTLGGETFFPVGQNIGWPDLDGVCFDAGTIQKSCSISQMSTVWCNGNNLPIPKAYQNFTDKIIEMSPNINFGRTMMVPWCWDFEFEKLGNYTDRLHIAWEMDRFFEICHDHNYYINFSMFWGLRFNDDNSRSIWDWVDQPNNIVNPNDEKFYAYKTELGLQNPEEFLTNPAAIKFYKQKLRYFMSRYGYSTNFAIIEMGNEMNTRGDYNLLTYQDNIENWHDVTTRYLKQTLKIDQLTTVNYGNGYDAEYDGSNTSQTGHYTATNDRSYSLDYVDIASYNFYPGKDARKYVDINLLLNRYLIGDGSNAISNPYGPFELSKPVIIGECGFMVERTICSPNIYLGYEDAVMLSTMGFAGVVQWDVRPEYYPKLKMLSNFMNNIDLDGEGFHGAVSHPVSNNRNKSAKNMMGRKEKTIFVHLVSNTNPVKAFGAIQNRTYNEYSMRNTSFDDNTGNLPPWSNTYPCVDASFNFGCDDLKDNFVPFDIQTNYSESSHEKIELHNMSNGQYQFEYYNAFDFTTQSTSSNGGNKKRIEYPPLNAYNRIVLFKSWQQGSSFTPLLPDPILKNKEMEVSVKSEMVDSMVIEESISNYYRELFVAPNLIKSGETVSINCEQFFGMSYILLNELGQEMQSGILQNSVTQINIADKGIFILILTHEQEILSQHKIVVI